MFSFEAKDVLTYFYDQETIDTSDDKIQDFLEHLVRTRLEQEELSYEEEEELLDESLTTIGDLDNTQINDLRHEIELILKADMERVQSRDEARQKVAVEDLVTFFVEGKRYTPGHGSLEISMVKDFWIWSGCSLEEVYNFGYDTLLDDRYSFYRKIATKFPSEEVIETAKLHEYFVVHLGRDAKTINISVKDCYNFFSYLGVTPPKDPFILEMSIRSFEDNIRGEL